MNTEQGQDEPVRRRRAGDGTLAELLGRAAGGDVDAFMAFYDETSSVTFRYALAGRRGDRDAAEVVTCDIYCEAWRAADQHVDSGLSPLAWLIAGDHRGQGTAMNEEQAR